MHSQPQANMTIACDIDTPPHKHSEQQTNKKKNPSHAVQDGSFKANQNSDH